MDPVVRRIRPGDGRELRAVRLAALLDSPSAFGSSHAREVDRPDDEWDRRAERSSSGTDAATCLAWIGDRPVGIVGAYRADGSPDVVELVSMWVAPAARRSGTGRSLVLAAVRWATETGATSVALWVTEGNEPAFALYETMGFVPTGDVRPLPSDPNLSELRMRLR